MKGVDDAVTNETFFSPDPLGWDSNVGPGPEVCVLVTDLAFFLEHLSNMFAAAIALVRLGGGAPVACHMRLMAPGSCGRQWKKERPVEAEPGSALGGAKFVGIFPPCRVGWGSAACARANLSLFGMNGRRRCADRMKVNFF